jgi:hypothetical protein
MIPDTMMNNKALVHMKIIAIHCIWVLLDLSKISFGSFGINNIIFPLSVLIKINSLSAARG